MAELPITNVINVTIMNTPQGLTERNVNSLALFTHEPTTLLDSYGIYVSPSQVAEDFGTASLTARMANAVFAQVPNLRTGNGRLVVIPMQSAVSATSGDFTSANISANLAALIAVTDGDLRVTVDSVNYDLTQLDFTNCTDFEDIARVIQGRLVSATVDFFEESGDAGIRITSKKVGASSSVSIGAVPGGAGTALNGSGYFNASGGTSANGVDSSGESLEDAIARMEGAVGFVPLMTTLSLEDAAIESASDFVQSRDKMFHHGVASTHDISGIIQTITDKGNRKTRMKLYTVSVEDAKLMNAAYAGRAHSVNFNGSMTAQTMNMKQLATIEPDDGINQTLYTQALAAGADLYVSYEGLPKTLSSGGNDYFDNIYNDLALKFAVEVAGFNFLAQTNTKVPQTEQGMNGLKTAYGNAIRRFVTNGCIAPGSWTSSERFGDPEVFDDNILNYGWYIYSLPITQQNPTERAQRKAPLVQIAIKRSGAIHTSDVIVVVND